MKNFTKSFLVGLITCLFSATASAYDLEVDGIYYNILSHVDLTVEVTSGGNKYTGDVVIPSTITHKSKTLAVTSIGEEAFEGCSSLTSIVIGDSVTSIGSSAFSNCDSLTSVAIPNSVTSIGNHAFYSCSGLTSVIIGNSVTSIGRCAFGMCSNLTSIEIPNSVTRIGDSAFEGCSSLTSIVIGNSVASIELKTFYFCSRLTSIVIGNSVTSIGYQAFYDCSELTCIYMQGTTPPYVDSSNFTTAQYIDVTLYVPNGSLATYQSANTWKNFWEIKEYDATGIDDISADNIETKFTGNGISVPNAVGKTVYVYNANGAVVEKFTHYDGGEIVLDKGTYTIRIGEKAIKVIF